MRKRNAWLAGILAGMASSATVVSTADYPRRQGTDRQRMRQDVWRVGGDFNTVINHYRGHTKKQ